MSRPIREGDEVIVVQLFPNQVEWVTPCIVLHMPQNAGDLLHIKKEDDKVEAINPSCAWFVGMERVEEDAKRFPG